MFIYNVTVNIENDIHAEWLDWMKTKHIPDVMKTGCFVNNRILRLLFVEEEGFTYSVQYDFEEMRDIERYQNAYAQDLQKEHKARFGDKYTAFRTLLELVP
jgi:hypothetical protein